MSHFRIAVRGSYLVAGVVPPRCRKPRTVEYDLTCEVRVRQVAKADAPVALVEDDSLHEQQVEYRWYKRRLYLPYKPNAGQTEMTPAGSASFAAEQRLPYTVRDVVGEADAIKEVRGSFKNFLVVDGEVWWVADEPGYVVATFGLGRNHGGTALLTDNVVYHNRARSCYFRADEFTLAREAALKTARERGDSNDVPRIESMSDPIRVLIPEAVRFQSDTWRAARNAQRRAVREQTRAARIDAANRQQAQFAAAAAAIGSPVGLLLGDA